MDREKVYEKLIEIFQEVFDDERIQLNDNTTSEDIEGWDSLEHINLIVAVENTFKFKFDMGEAGSMENVGEMVDMILKKM